MQNLWNSDAEQNGKDKSLIVDVYKHYVDKADKISERRTQANNFFVTINSSLITVYGLVTAKTSLIQGGPWLWLVPTCGLATCLLWYYTIRSYRDLNSGKFAVIHEIEKALPLSPYAHEWHVLEEGKTKKYRPISHIESFVPYVFGILYGIILIWPLLRKLLLEC